MAGLKEEMNKLRLERINNEGSIKYISTTKNENKSKTSTIHSTYNPVQSSHAVNSLGNRESQQSLSPVVIQSSNYHSNLEAVTFVGKSPIK